MADETSGSVGGLYFDLGLKMDDLMAQFEDVQDKLGEALNGAPVDGFNKKIKGSEKSAISLGGALKTAFAAKVVWDFTKACMQATAVQQAAEIELTSVMQRRMNATKEQIQSVKDLASELQTTGIIGDEVTLSAAAQFATFTTSIESLRPILPAMQDLAVARANGQPVGAQAMEEMAKKFGKSIATGSITELAELGIVPTEAELKAWERLISDEEKAAYLAQLVANNVGDMNELMRGQFGGAVQGLKNDFGDLEEKFGRIAQVVLLPCVNILDQIVLRLGQVADGVMEFFGIEMTDIDENKLVSGSQALADNMAEATKEAKEYNKTVLGFDKAFILPDQSEDDSSSTATPSANTYYYYNTTNNNNSSSAASNATNAEAKETNRLVKEFGELFGAIGTSIKRIIDGIGDFFGALGELFDKLGVSQWWKEKFGPQLKEGFFDTIDELTKYFEMGHYNYFFELGGEIGEEVDELTEKIGTSVSNFGKGLRKFGNDAVSWVLSWPVFSQSGTKTQTKNTSNTTSTTTAKTGLQKASDWFFHSWPDWWPESLRFADGGFFPPNTPVLGMFGDNMRENEYALPEGKLKALINSGGGNAETNALIRELIQEVRNKELTAAITGDSVARMVIKILREEQRNTGRSLI